MKNLFIVCSTLLAVALRAFAQTEVDLYRYSNTFNEGSARFEGMSGSFGALGADLGSARINPAGFARYSSSQFSFGLNTVTASNKAEFRGNTDQESATKFRLANTGLVITTDKSGNRGGFLYQQFGIGYNGVANFGNKWSYSGRQFESLLDGFASQATGVAPEQLATYFPFSTSLAYETYAIDDDGTGNYYPRLTSGDMLHKRTVTTRGGLNELFLSYSANYLNKLYLGANVGFQFLRYKELTEHHEDLIDTVGVSLRSFDYTYDLGTSGSGTNLKLGVIYLPVDWIRIGLAYHTPTFFELTDKWTADMVATHDSGVLTVPPSLKPYGNYKYKLRTPARMIASFAMIFGTKGCVNVDVEYLDYRKANFKSTNDQNYPSYNYAAENQAAKERFTNVLNIRAGGEYVINTIYFLRAGYGFFPKGDTALYSYGGRFDQQVSCGAGIRFNSWTIDFALRRLTQTRQYTAFPGSTADIRTNNLYIVFNAQVKF